MSDPLSYLVASVERELEADDDKVDEFYRAMGKSEGEIDSYRHTRIMMRAAIRAAMKRKSK